MKRRASWAKLWTTLGRAPARAGAQTLKAARKQLAASRRAPAGSGGWHAGVAVGTGGARQFRLFKPAGVGLGERLPLMVMLHGCQQDAKSFAASTRMNLLAARHRFLVLYPEQDSLANPQRCWNWFDTRSRRAYTEAALILQAVDQVCTLYRADKQRVAIAGLSAGASMAALMAVRYPDRFKAVTMHSGVAPGKADSTLSAIGAMRGRRGGKSAVLASGGDMAHPMPPLLVIQGDADTVVAASNGRDAATAWAATSNALPTPARDVQRGKRYAMHVTEFKLGTATRSTLVEVNGLGHAWSGGAASQPFSDPRGPDASRMAWAFSAKQFALDRTMAS